MTELRQFYQRWQHLEAEKAEAQADLSELFKEAKARGFNAKVMRAVFRQIANEEAKPAEMAEFADLFSIYRAAVNGTPVATHAGAHEEDHHGQVNG